MNLTPFFLGPSTSTHRTENEPDPFFSAFFHAFQATAEAKPRRFAAVRPVHRPPKQRRTLGGDGLEPPLLPMIQTGR
jgi:hypothetical protein